MIVDRRRRARATFLVPALIAASLAALFSGCTKEPSAPTWNNPFDPSTGGDPFHLRAVISSNAVTVLWDRPAYPDIASFEILRSLDGAEYAVAGLAGATATTFRDVGFAPNHVNYYKVAVRNHAEEISAVSRVVAAQVLAPPWLDIAGGASTVATRYVVLTIRTQVGDTLEIAATSDFAGAIRVPATPGGTDLVPWDLGAAAADNAGKQVWLRVHTGPVLSPVAADTVRTAFHPDLQIAGAPATVASRRLTAVIGGGAGVTQLRFATALAGLPAAAWSPPDSVAGGQAYFTGDLLGSEPTTQRLFCEALGDFGYAALDSLDCVPDGLAGAGFVLAGGAPMTEDALVGLRCEAVATEMRFSESPDLSVVPWQAFRDTTEFALSQGAGQKIVYAQFRNDWFSAIAADTILFVQTGGATRR